MTVYGTIKIPMDRFEEHNRRRKDAGLTWEEYLDKESVTITHEIDHAAVADRVAEQVVAGLEGRVR